MNAAELRARRAGLKARAEVPPPPPLQLEDFPLQVAGLAMSLDGRMLAQLDTGPASPASPPASAPSNPRQSQVYDSRSVEWLAMGKGEPDRPALTSLSRLTRTLRAFDSLFEGRVHRRWAKWVKHAYKPPLYPARPATELDAAWVFAKNSV